jgi:hypothetical protein
VSEREDLQAAGRPAGGHTGGSPHQRGTQPEQAGPVTAGSDQAIGGAATGGGWPPAPDQAEVFPRPVSLDPQHLGFTPRKPVPWLGPTLLAGTAVRVLLAELFGAYLDKRELQNAFASTIYDERPGASPDVDAPNPPDDAELDDTELWLDYVADVGDGFNATYSVAYLLAQRELAVEGEPLPLPRGRVLVFGGDQVYPTASGQQYEDRFKGPYRAALPAAPCEGEQPSLYALPGNHDWYDGLTAFLRLFARSEHGRIGGWHTRQSRSYFTIRLPQRWWLFAVDAQFGAYIDDPQVRYFREAAKQLRPGDRVILCTPSPSWVQAYSADSTAYDTTDYFVRRIIAPTGAQVRLMLSGDWHHYARYTNADRELITCGGGGAYLYPTHRLPESIQVPPDASLVLTPSPAEQYKLAATYPSKRQSRGFAAGVFGRLPFGNPGFITLVGILHLLLMLAMANASQRVSSPAVQRLVTIPLLLMAVIVVGACVAFAMPATGGRRARRHRILGLGHGAAHLGVGAGGTWVALQTPFHGLPWPLPLLSAFLLYLPAAGLVGSLLVALYLVIASTVNVNVNELFAAQGIIDCKSFLRMHIARDGSLTIYPFAVDEVSRRWVPVPDATEPDASWLAPEEPLRYHLAEPSIKIS